MRNPVTISRELRDVDQKLAGILQRTQELSDVESRRSLNPAEQTEFKKINTRSEALIAEKQDLESEWRSAMIEHGKNPGNYEEGSDRSVQFMKRTETSVNAVTATRNEVRDAALKTLENEHRDQKTPISDATAGKLEKDFSRLVRDRDGKVQFDGDYLARRFLVTESPAYRSAWQKSLAYAQPAFTDEEARAVSEFRATEQGLTDASGGFGTPLSLDPSVIVTSGAEQAPLLDVARVENITSDQWAGVASDGVTFTATAEATAATATQATLSQPTITPEKTMAYIPYSFEIGGDYPNFAQEMAALIEQAYIDFLAVETATGSAGVIGAFTALDATASSEVNPTTDGLLGPEDALVVWNALPERHRSRATWFMNVTVESQLRTGADGYGSRDLSSEGIAPLLGKRVLLSDYAPSFTGTTGASNLAILADFGSGYLVAQRVGMSIELIPNVVDESGVPTGQRAWLAWARVGADFINDNAGILLQNA